MLVAGATLSQQSLAANNSGMNVTLPAAPNAPSTGVYYNADGKYAGTTQSVNGSTSYYHDGQYQGQAPNGSNQYYNQQNNPEIIDNTGTINRN